MAKFYGVIGYAVTEETKPGVWKEQITERNCIYKGVEDSDDASIEDSNGVAITGKVVYSIK